MIFTIKDLWNKLGDIPINEHEEIELQFLQFEPGTHKYDIWHWFEETFNISVNDLMFKK